MERKILTYIEREIGSKNIDIDALKRAIDAANEKGNQNMLIGYNGQV